MNNQRIICFSICLCFIVNCFCLIDKSFGNISILDRGDRLKAAEEYQKKTTNPEEYRLIRKAAYWNETENYQEYIDKFPDGVFAEQASLIIESRKNKIANAQQAEIEYEETLFHEILDTEDVLKYRDFLTRYPNSKYSYEIKTRIDEVNWKWTLKKDEAKYYRSYIDSNLTGIHVEEAKILYDKMYAAERIPELEAKVKLMPASDFKGNLMIYQELLKLEPNSKRYQDKVAHYTQKMKENEKLNNQKREVSDIEILGWKWGKSSDRFVTARGLIRNVSGHRLEYVKAVVTWKTKDGTYIIHDSNYVEYTSLLPDQKSPFEIMVNYNPLMHSASLAFSVRGKRLAAFETE